MEISTDITALKKINELNADGEYIKSLGQKVFNYEGENSLDFSKSCQTLRNFLVDSRNALLGIKAHIPNLYPNYSLTFCVDSGDKDLDSWRPPNALSAPIRPSTIDFKRVRNGLYSLSSGGNNAITLQPCGVNKSLPEMCFVSNINLVSELRFVDSGIVLRWDKPISFFNNKKFYINITAGQLLGFKAAPIINTRASVSQPAILGAGEIVPNDLWSASPSTVDPLLAVEGDYKLKISPGGEATLFYPVGSDSDLGANHSETIRVDPSSVRHFKFKESGMHLEFSSPQNLSSWEGANIAIKRLTTEGITATNFKDKNDAPLSGEISAVTVLADSLRLNPWKKFELRASQDRTTLKIFGPAVSPGVFPADLCVCTDGFFSNVKSVAYPTFGLTLNWPAGFDLAKVFPLGTHNYVSFDLTGPA